MPLCLREEEVEESVEFLEMVECWSELEKQVLVGNARDELNSFDVLRYYGAMYGYARMPQERKSIIPGSLVKKEGIDYCIHGIMHVPEKIPHFCERFNGLKQGVCESRLNRMLGNPNIVEQGRVDECKYVPVIDSAKSFGFFYGINLALDIYSWVVSRFESRESKEEIEYLMELNAEIDERFIMAIGDTPVFMDDVRLPERLEHSYIESCINEDYFRRFCTLRSLSQADFIENFAKSRGINEAHGIYGMAHEPEIAYFLRYPEKAEEYRDRFKKRLFFF